jgi:hypothetical protein
MPSVRTPVFHSPYSTVSASSAHMRVLTPAVETPMRAKNMIGTQGVDGGERVMPTPATTPMTPKPRNAFFLPIAVTSLGMNGAMMKIDPTLRIARTVSRLAFPSTSRA